MGRKLAALALCIGLLCSQGAGAAPEGEISPGVEAHPEENAPVTRGEVLLLLWQSAGAVPYDKTAHPFADLASRDDLGQAAGWAYGLGLVKGVGDGLFAPDRPMTREELATLLRRNNALLGLDTWLPDGAALCNDYADISPWADDSLYWACIMGRMAWRDCRLAPLDFATYAEAEELFPPLFGSEMEYPEAWNKGLRGSLDWSEAEREAARRPGDQAESEGKRPSDQTFVERDSQSQKP